MKNFFFSLLAILLVFSSAMAADVSITAANVVPGANAQYRYGIAGAAITAGQLVYLDVTSNTWKLTDSNVLASADVDGIAIVSTASGAPITVITQDDDLTLGGTAAKGTIYLASANPGGIAPSADLTTGWYAVVVGLGKSATKIIFRAEGLRNTVAQ